MPSHAQKAQAWQVSIPGTLGSHRNVAGARVCFLSSPPVTLSLCVCVWGGGREVGHLTHSCLQEGSSAEVGVEVGEGHAARCPATGEGAGRGGDAAGAGGGR